MPRHCGQAWLHQGFDLPLDLLQGDHQCALQHSFQDLEWHPLESVHLQVHLQAPDLGDECQHHPQCRGSLRYKAIELLIIGAQLMHNLLDYLSDSIPGCRARIHPQCKTSAHPEPSGKINVEKVWCSTAC